MRGRNIYVEVRPISTLDDQSGMRLKKRDGKKKNGGAIYQKWGYARVYANGQNRELVALKKKKNYLADVRSKWEMLVNKGPCFL
ncbi:hypothetical protein POVCU1_047120 [Plasmodium ovale curtisi]|uniref:Uncharacterized protein n=1 Tax=Plasmodium ovale curtisi TaxID=864141 RepID=A0A1A8X476_PLAOA|nr:hypothetical protein POVCU1_047120 [Plasmodium ovale curtisi]